MISSGRVEWSSKMAFILATVGSAVGLGNIWRFPYVAGENGGGAFVLIYLACVLLIGLPIMVSELLIGRASKQSPALAFYKLASKNKKIWQLIGYLGIAAAFILTSYYSVVGGWTLAYAFKSITLELVEVNSVTAGEVFKEFTSTATTQIFWTLLFIGIGVFVVLRGIKDGLENFNKIFIPALFGMIILLVINGLFSQGAEEGLKFLFWPDFSKVTISTVLAAMGQAFFSLSIGMGAILTYGSYLHSKENLVSSSMTIILLDSFVAIFIGVAIFPVLFSYNIEPTAGPGLAFMALPAAFTNFGPNLAPILTTIFFLILAFAALTSSVSIIEPVVAHMVDKEWADRKIATLVIGIFAFLLSIPSALSNGANKFFSEFGHYLFAGVNNLEDKSFMELADFIVSDNILPIGGFCIALFVFFVVDNVILRKEVSMFYKVWKFLLPIATLSVAAVYLVNALIIPEWFNIAVVLLIIVMVVVLLSQARVKRPNKEEIEEVLENILSD
jgi:NSS family neurotransmitter:Na+ symporter